METYTRNENTQIEKKPNFTFLSYPAIDLRQRRYFSCKEICSCKLLQFYYIFSPIIFLIKFELFEVLL